MRLQKFPPTESAFRTRDFRLSAAAGLFFVLLAVAAGDLFFALAQSG